MTKKVLFLGNIPTDDERSIGGATVLAKSILTFLQDNKTVDVTHLQIRTSWKKYYQLFDYIILSIKAPFVFFKFDVISIHATSDFHFTFAPIIWIWAKLFRKKITYHFFGGIFYEKFLNKNRLHKYILMKTILQSDKLFIETKMMIDSFKKEGVKNCIWLPNSRKKTNIIINDSYNEKFVFISRVTPTKGIDEIIKASEKLPKEYKIHIYGPLDEKKYTSKELNKHNLKYKGVLQAEDVSDVLSQYDVLLLPTYHKGEGYPGIIIESLSLGIPVITTNWRSIPEIINKHNGILIEPKNHIELVKAIKFFNKKNYPNYKIETLRSFNEFSSDFVFKKIITSYLN